MKTICWADTEDGRVCRKARHHLQPATRFRACITHASNREQNIKYKPHYEHSKNKSIAS
jgi:hypothetical protein